MQNRNTVIWLSLAVVVLAPLAGFGIAWIDGGQPGRPKASSPYTPPPRTAIAIVRTAIPSPTRSPTRRPAASTPQPTRPATMTPTSAATTATTATSAVTPASSPTATPMATDTQPALAQVASGPVNMRSGPGLTYPVLGLAPAGGTYPVTARSADGAWWRVCCVRGAPAWVASSIISATGSIDVLPILNR
jgi:hypothetical protein